MDNQMLPSPTGAGDAMFTPIHHPEIDQQILEHAFQQQTSHTNNQPQGMPHLTPYGSLATGTGQSTIKAHTYAPSYAPSTPQQLMSQTPVSLNSILKKRFLKVFIAAKSHVANGTDARHNGQLQDPFIGEFAVGTVLRPPNPPKCDATTNACRFGNCAATPKYRVDCQLEL